MANNQHTPGPWKIESYTGKKGEKYVWMAGEYLGGHAIATVHDKIPERADDNARLISTAPELLESLENLERVASFTFHDNPLLAEAIIQARTVIAKAKGE